MGAVSYTHLQFISLYRYFIQSESYRDEMQALSDAAFYTYQDTGIGKAAARALYSPILRGSVTVSYTHLDVYKRQAENGFRQLTNSEHPVRSVEDLKNLKLRVAGSNLLMKCYELWGADATNMNWSETYTALQQGTVDGQENPLPAIDAASVQEVQKYVSLWNANYDCLFFCINQKLYDSLTPEPVSYTHLLPRNDICPAGWGFGRKCRE